MPKLTFRLATALLTFIIGVVTASLCAIHYFRRAEEMPIPNPIVPDAKVVSSIYSGWQKIDVEGKVSFYLPPNMKEITPPNIPEADRAFRREKTSKDEFLYLYYVYGKRASCDRDSDFANKEIHQKSGIVISGKRAILNLWQTERAKYLTDLPLLPEMTLCFSDVGHDKSKLYFYVGAPNLEGLEAAQQIFNSIEFH